MQKTKDDWDCRAISEDFLDKFRAPTANKKGVSYAPFIELVKKHSELSLAFRGNDYVKENPLSGGKVVIYRNNHAMFTITKQKVSFNPNYLRYSPDWQTILKKLIQCYGYNNGKMLRPGNVKYSKNVYTNVETWSCSFAKDSINANLDEDYFNHLEDIYELLSKVFDRFFDENDYLLDRFLLWCNDNDEAFKGKIKQKRKKIELEKIRQQQLFECMKEQKNGYFFYDMEFQQKHRSKSEREEDRKKGLNNKPDMQAIRFDNEGKPSAWVFVEVKCTEAAYGGKSGLMTHIEKMKLYIKNTENLERRRREAALILMQYQELGLIQLERKVEETEYLHLPAEIVLIFTDAAIRLWNNEKNEELIGCRRPTQEIKISEGVDAVLVELSY